MSAKLQFTKVEDSDLRPSFLHLSGLRIPECSKLPKCTHHLLYYEKEATFIKLAVNLSHKGSIFLKDAPGVDVGLADNSMSLTKLPP